MSGGSLTMEVRVIVGIPFSLELSGFCKWELEVNRHLYLVILAILPQLYFYTAMIWPFKRLKMAYIKQTWKRLNCTGES